MMRHALAFLLLSAAASGPPLTMADEPTPGADADQLAKQLSNPIAALISVPLQLNWDTGYGEGGDGERWQLNIQPVAPFHLNEEWNVISRTILPVIDQEDVIPGSSESGIGDITQSLFFLPGSRRRAGGSGASARLSSCRPRPTIRSGTRNGQSARPPSCSSRPNRAGPTAR